MRRSGKINPVSKRRQKVNRERAKAQVKAWGPRPWRCQMFYFVWVHENDGERIETGPCLGEVNGHEIVPRGRSGSDDNLVDVRGQVPLCNRHNEWCSSHPKAAEALGLLRHQGADE